MNRGLRSHVKDSRTAELNPPRPRADRLLVSLDEPRAASRSPDREHDQDSLGSRERCELLRSFEIGVETPLNRAVAAVASRRRVRDVAVFGLEVRDEEGGGPACAEDEQVDCAR